MSRYDIYYGNGLKQGIEEEQAVADLSTLLKLEEKAARGIISRTNRVIKSGLDEKQARRYFELLDKVGLQIEIRGPDLVDAHEETQIMRPVIEEPGAYEPTAVMQAVREEPRAAEPPAPPPPPAPEAGASAADKDGEPRIIPVLFHGRGFEYFKIWIVNVLLSILTLGIYSAWAKVRNKQYFYGNTEIEGSSFQYTAKPLQILIGRLIAFGIFLVYIGINQVFPPAGPVLGLIFLLFLPWIVIRSLAFNARNSMYRNVRFRFSGGVGEAVVAYILMPILSFISLGLLLPLAWHRQIRFLVRNHSFGTTSFVFEAGVGPFYRLLGKLLLVGIGAVVLIGILAAAMGVSGTTVQQNEDLFGLLIMPFMFVAYAFMFAVIEAGLGNLRFNHSRLGEVYFNSELTLFGMARLYIVNTFAIVLSLGLLIPWAKVRTAAYRASCLTLVAASLDGFVAAEEQKVSALGEQLGEVFDVDILGGI